MSDSKAERRRFRGGGGAARRAERTSVNLETAKYIERNIPLFNVLNDEAFLSQPYDEGLWIKGLSYYRKGKYQKASRQFLILSKISDNKWLRDAGAYWSFLSSTKGWNRPIALDPPPTQAKSKSGDLPNALMHCFFVSSPITA